MKAPVSEGRTPSLTDRFYLPDYSMLFAIKELAGFQRGATSPLGAVGTPTMRILMFSIADSG
jgi:hypothetical protein